MPHLYSFHNRKWHVFRIRITAKFRDSVFAPFDGRATGYTAKYHGLAFPSAHTPQHERWTDEGFCQREEKLHRCWPISCILIIKWGSRPPGHMLLSACALVGEILFILCMATPLCPPPCHVCCFEISCTCSYWEFFPFVRS